MSPLKDPAASSPESAVPAASCTRRSHVLHTGKHAVHKAPYKAPYMFLDLQRAIRFLRFHAEEYGFDPDQIATVGIWQAYRRYALGTRW